MRRDDYRRGRAAIGVLTRKRRPGSTPRTQKSRRVPFALSAVGALAVAAVAVGLAVLGNHAGPAETRPGIGHRPTPAAPERLVTHPSPTQRILVLDSVWFDSWEDAQHRTRWPLREPTSLPAEFRLTALQAFVLDASSPLDDIMASYTGPAGASVSFSQALVAAPSAYSFERAIPSPPADIELQRIEIDGSMGYWMRGVPIVDDSGIPAGWDREAIVVEWQSADVLYRLSGRGVELALLLDIADSLARVRT